MSKPGAARMSSRAEPDRAKSPYRLLVEGSDDLHSIIHLMQRHGVNWNDSAARLPYVDDSKGIENVLSAITTSAKTHERLGIVVDADLDCAGRWLEIRNRLQRCGLDSPAEPALEGLILSGLETGWRVGIWLMPNNRSSGILEDFLATLVPPADPCWKHAEDSTTKARELKAPLAEKDHMKGAIHTWLAWQEVPGRAFGTAITQRVFDHDSDDALRFVAWFKRLFLDAS